jgi:hypothetical protein
MKRSPLVLAASLALLPASAGSETLNMSRLIYRLTANGYVLASKAVPQAALLPYCGDADGCMLTLKIEDGYGLEVRSTRLYLSEIDPLLWLSEASPVAGAHRDADGNADSALSLWSGFSNCGIGDYQVGAPDEVAGFTFGLVGTANLVVTCAMVVED